MASSTANGATDSEVTRAGMPLPGKDMPINHYDVAHSNLGDVCATCGYHRGDKEIYDQATHWTMEPLTVLELRLVDLINRITDKPKWYEKVFDPAIACRWRDEARTLYEELDAEDNNAKIPRSLLMAGTRGAAKLGPTGTEGGEAGESGSEEGSEDEDMANDDHLHDKLADETTDALGEIHQLQHAMRPPMTGPLLDFCFDELRHRASRWQRDGLVPVVGLCGADIVKSDTAVPESFRNEFASLCQKLQDSIEADWHPHQDGLVRDLVHPSLYPLRYGHSRVTSESIPVERATDYTNGKGETLPSVDSVDENGHAPQGSSGHPDTRSVRPLPSAAARIQEALKMYSARFQWLPAEVSLEGGAKFTSYVNNLHYPQHAGLYDALAKLIDYSIPLWNRCIATAEYQNVMRRHCVTDEAKTWDADVSLDDLPPAPEKFYFEELLSRSMASEEELNEAWGERWVHFNRRPNWPTPPTFAEWSANFRDEKQVNLDTHYSGLQIIVKLANIELTPENARYPGGSWHVEGLANEHICATSIFYYDSENISESRIEFRCGGEIEDFYDYPQDEFQGLERMYGSSLREEAALVELARVTTPQGRLLAFPNVFQHRVQPFELADKARSGHRKIAVLWLVNPQKRIISTAHVPPQQKQPWEQQFRNVARRRFPNEIVDMIVDHALSHLDTEEDAKRERILLMEERKVPHEKFNEISASYNFCEH